MLRVHAIVQFHAVLEFPCKNSRSLQDDVPRGSASGLSRTEHNPIWRVANEMAIKMQFLLAASNHCASGYCLVCKSEMEGDQPEVTKMLEEAMARSQRGFKSWGVEGLRGKRCVLRLFPPEGNSPSFKSISAQTKSTGSGGDASSGQAVAPWRRCGAVGKVCIRYKFKVVVETLKVRLPFSHLASPSCPLMNLPLDAASYNQLGQVFNSVSVHGAPLLAQEAALTAYCSVVALIWTWALCVPEEVEIVQRKGLSMPIIAYYITRHCYIWGPLTLPGNVSVLANDTLVFIGVSLHAYRNMTLDTSRLSHVRRFKILIQGNGLYKVSRMLLKSGQLYYGQIWTTAAVFLGLPYSQMVFMTYIPFSSTLACKVFRMVMLCDTVEDPLSTLEIHEMFEIMID
ncbi:hypothetical protein FIBSPDRAFT_891502 [Athelia psychrophila]|uniref:Uncharacterized protein n=1 Tax=Athelia psychrophila TaxID=1759441 RepID=A0A166JIK5_9AGAM|nr:hypothetical protein FIBSPDRAFT_891502 [Fibularhizoctonia sp. CBS 109695]